MFKVVNWGEKFRNILGGHKGRILRILVLFLCALGVLVGIYRARTNRIIKQQGLNLKKAANQHNSRRASTARWVIVADPGSNDTVSLTGEEYSCVVADVALQLGWKTIIINHEDYISNYKKDCCKMPECYRINSSQFLRMGYRTSQVLKKLIDQSEDAQVYKEPIRNLAYLWVIHKGARHIFDAYVEEFIEAQVSLEAYRTEFHRQMSNLALDESLALVEERRKGKKKSHSESSLFRNPYSHFGRGDVKLLVGGNSFHHHTFHHYTYNLAHRHLGSSYLHNLGHHQKVPSYRICEVRVPSIEKFLEIDEGWWDTNAPSLVLPGDTMPPLCTRNTLFSPEVFWALPLFPDYSMKEEAMSNFTVEDWMKEELVAASPNGSISVVPPWYIRGLWSQTLLGDLGGSIRLSLSKLPTLQLNEDYYVSIDDEALEQPKNATSSKLLKRWHCRSRSTFRCLLLMARELAKSVYLKKQDLALIEAWILDMKAIHYAEPPMLPRRRSRINPCLGADGLHGVSFYPALEPNPDFLSYEFISARNDTLKSILGSPSESIQGSRDKRQTALSPHLLPPAVNSTYSPFLYTTENTSNAALPHNSYYGFQGSENSKGLGKDSGKKFRALLQEVAKKTAETAAEEFPLLKAMTETMCKGFGRLMPYQPNTVHSNILLIVVFKNQHYDLIPTLEVLYRQHYPNILYCGHPHESVSIYLRKYQSVEKRSFSFLPTYTRASYECVLGAMEMNFNVDGYLVINDETLMTKFHGDIMDKNNLWVGSDKELILTEDNWRKFDPRGQKLPKILDGVLNTWKLFSYILIGHDAWVVDSGHQHPHRHQRSVGKRVDENYSDLAVSDWDYVKSLGRMFYNDSVLVGEENDDALDVTDLLSDNSTGVPVDVIGNGTEDTIIPFWEEDIKNKLVNHTSGGANSEEVSTTKPSSSEEESVVDVPLYHVEHAEPPTPPTWHKPEGSVHSEEKAEVKESSLELELRSEMEALLLGVKDAYSQMVGLVDQYLIATNETEESVNPKRPSRISPREFRHIRCYMQEDGRPLESDLCHVLRRYIKTLSTDSELYHYDAIPMYYLPSWTTKPFYSVANVLLHFGVMDEIALPLLFRGLKPHQEWQYLQRGSPGNYAEGNFLHPFNLNLVLSSSSHSKDFCYRFFLPLLQS